MKETVKIAVQKLPHAPADLPAYQTEGSAGMDLHAALQAPVTLKPLERTLVPTGLIIALPEGYEAQIRSRSGLASKHGIAVVNGVGTIDWDYRHEVKVALVNLSQDNYSIMPGDRIAQMVVAPVSRVEWDERPELAEEALTTSGRAGGFGSTGR